MSLTVTAQGLTPYGEACTRITALERQLEILADIAFNIGYAWYRIDKQVQSAIMEELEGSRGLKDLFYEWAKEFDHIWENLDPRDPRHANYMEAVDAFSFEKIETLKTMIRLDM